MIIEQIGLLKQIEVREAKRILQGIYIELGIRKKAKATDLNKLFYIKTIINNSVRYTVLLQTKIAENERINLK